MYLISLKAFILILHDNIYLILSKPETVNGH